MIRFVKLPQQVSGVVSDRVVETIDILPTIADVLSATVPYEVDGRSLLDVSAPDRPPRTCRTDRRARRVHGGEEALHARQLS